MTRGTIDIRESLSFPQAWGVLGKSVGDLLGCCLEEVFMVLGHRRLHYRLTHVDLILDKHIDR